MADSLARQRPHALAGRDSNTLFASLPARSRPLITYGKRTKPLSLTGTQFIRANPYDIPPDSQHDDYDQADVEASCKDADGAGSAPEHSPLSDRISDGETERPRLEGHACIPSKGSPMAVRSEVRKGATTEMVGDERGRATRRSRAKPKRGRPLEVQRVQDKVSRPNNAARSRRVSRKITPTRPLRRLPVNELFLVASPLQYSPKFDPASSPPGINIQDPIQDQSGTSGDRSVSPGEVQADQNAATSNAPLSAIRKRLRTPAPRHKPLRVRKRKPDHWLPNSGDQMSASKSGDGFEIGELRIPSRVKSQTHRKRNLRVGYAPLLLGSGPLPDVLFDVTTSQLETEPGCGATGMGDAGQLEDKRQPSTQRSRQAVSFSDRDELIMARLSAVSAPERHYSDSDLGLEDAEIGDDEEDVLEEMSDRHSDIDEDETEQNEELPDKAPPINDEDPVEGLLNAKHPPRDHDRRQATVRASPAQRSNTRILLDLRSSAMPGRAPKAVLEKRHTIETAEKFERYDTVTAKHITDSSPLEPLQALRRRSILKNSTPAVAESTSRFEDTAANTRHNSVVELELDESRYFTNAMGGLRAQDLSGHRVIPRRRSSYFNNSQIEVPDSEHVVPQTSLEAPDYTNPSQLHVLRKNSEAVWASHSRPTVPKDLKTLTRSVSREHGTLSQALRRRTSLPFQSPTKVR